MKVQHFMVPGKMGGKFYMALILSPAEQTALEQAGGFSEVMGTKCGWSVSALLKASKWLPDKNGYLFYGYYEQVDFIRDRLTHGLDWVREIKNIKFTPSHAELLAKLHGRDQIGILNLYIDYDLPSSKQRSRMLWGTYWPRDDREYEIIMGQYRSSNSRVKLAQADENAIVSQGFFRSRYAYLQSYLNEKEGFSMSTNVIDSQDTYATLLLKSVL